MSKFYKGRYLIAVYEPNDEDFVCTCANMDELKEFLETEWAHTIMSRYIKTFGTFPIIRCNKYVFHFIDIYEKHNDVFDLEDKEFIKEFCEKPKPSECDEYCKRHKCSRKTYYRMKEKLKKEKENELTQC